MDKPREKLLKILRLEAEKYQDRAVLGGLTRFADTWLKEARGRFPKEIEWVDEVANRLRAYSGLASADERAGALREIMTLVEEGPRPLAPPAESPPPAPQKEPAGLDAPLTTLRGVGKQQARRLARLGLHTIRDLVYFLPRRYDDFSSLKPINRLEYGEEVTIIAKVYEARSRKTKGGAPIFKAVLTDGTGFIEATWFNQPYLAERIRRGQQIVLSGKVDEYLGRLCLTSPEWEPLRKELLHTGRLVPVYPLTGGVTARWIRQLVKRTVDFWVPRIPDPLPASIREANRLMDLNTALRQVHYPDDKDHLKEAQRRLAFDELFVLQLGLLRQRYRYRSLPGRQLPIESETLQTFVLNLPFQLTGAQQRALDQIVRDLSSPYPMNRLLQGDVGSGKTVVAAGAMALTIETGAQAAMMAPTEILAEQHFKTLTRLFDQIPDHNPTIRLLTGSTSAEERAAVYEGLADGTVDIAVGTHALIQENVAFHDLALVVIDEQHRFGVRQRAALRQKGQEGSYNPHMLVMTATPIPRSLQLTVWGHLDVSVIDEMPPGRQPITTRIILPSERERAYAFLRHQVEMGRQAFIICPLVEESDKIEAKAAVEEYERLQKVIFPDLRLGLLHGRMKGKEKEATMTSFARGELDILVSTSVVEVGIDVPNATVMLIEGAERFGLAQLHQFRGRVGRGEHPSYCLLVSESASEEAAERLAAMEATSDGFVLAQKDLEMRGPGEFLGVRQSGFPDLKMASLFDLRLLERVRESARSVIEEDPELERPEHALLARRLALLWQDEGEVS